MALRNPLAKRRRRRVIGGACTCLWLIATGVVPAGAQADVSDDPAHAAPREVAFFPERIDRSRDRDWFEVDGAPFRTGVLLTKTDPTCPGAAPLLVSIHNPEVSWMRTIAVSRGEEASFDVPASTSRYLFAVQAADPLCAGLEYRVARIEVRRARGYPPGPARCRISRGEFIQAERAASLGAGALANAGPRSRPRKERELDQLRRERASARDRYRACPRGS